MSQVTDGTVKFTVRDSRLNSLLDILYPVGSIKITISSSAPFSDLGFGTWEEVSKGRVLWGADDSHAAGSTIEAGLPNITGMLGDSSGDTGLFWGVVGAFYGTHESNPQNRRSHFELPIGNSSPTGETMFDASRCSNVYGNSDTVTPPSYVVHFWQRTA